MYMFKNVDWKDLVTRGLMEALFAISYFVLMYFVLTFVFTNSGVPIESNLMHVLITMTTLITYFATMDKRDMEKRFDVINEKLDFIEDTTEASWDILMSDDDEFTVEELKEMMEDIQNEIDERNKDFHTVIK